MTITMFTGTRHFGRGRLQRSEIPVAGGGWLTCQYEVASSSF